MSTRLSRAANSLALSSSPMATSNARAPSKSGMQNRVKQRGRWGLQERGKPNRTVGVSTPPRLTSADGLLAIVDGVIPIPYVQQAGVAYLKSLEPGEATVGVYITDAWKAETFDVQTIKLLLSWAFEEVGFHRIQTALLEGPHKVSLMKLFSHVGFSHEGTRRKAQVGPDAVYKDVTCMGMVDMDWRLWAGHIATPRTLWDRLFDRQQREREEILVDDGDDEDRFLGRKGSTETLKANIDEYVRSAKSTTTGSIAGGSGSNAVTSWETGGLGSESDWDGFDQPKSLPDGHGSDAASLESDFEELILKRSNNGDEPPVSVPSSSSISDSESMSFVDRDVDWEEYGERVEYP